MTDSFSLANVPISQDIREVSPLLDIGQVANQYADAAVFTTYQGHLDPNTIKRQRIDLAFFALYLSLAGAPIQDYKQYSEELFTDPRAWTGMTYGLLESFRKWMLREGYAIGSINIRLSTLRAYCALATKAQVIPLDEYTRIKLVTNISYDRGMNIDEHRREEGIETRKKDTYGNAIKRAQAISIPDQLVPVLKLEHLDTPQGHRDAFMMCLFLGLGLRCGEVADLQVADLHLAEGQLVFYREKVKKTQKLELDKDTLLAAMRYMEACRPEKHLLLGSRKSRDGQKMIEGFGRRCIAKRVEYICQRFGLEDVSPHALRHKWVDLMIEGGTDMKTLQEAGGWNSVAMPMHYASKHEIANAGAKLKTIPYIPYHKQLQQLGQ